MAGGPPLRHVLGALLAAVVLLAILLSAVTVVQLGTAEDRSQAERRRVASFRLADQVRQSSNDLTRMVRLYVTTGDQRYRDYYDRILEIRRGTAPRPVGYDSSFWDRVIADGYGRARVGPAVALPELMRRAAFSREELAALGRALAVSDRLARLEVATMDAVARRARPGSGDRALQGVAPLYRRLVSPAYHAEKRRIMAEIERFIALVDRRAADRSAQLRDRTGALLVGQTAVLGVLGLLFLLLLAYATRTIVRPLGRLAAVTRRIRGGDWGAHARPEGVREIQQLAGDFEEMTDAVQRELLARKRMELEATEARRRLQTIADRVPGSVFHFHVDQHQALSVRFASRDASVHGVGIDDDVDFPVVARAVLPEDRGAWVDSLLAAAREGEAWDHEYRIVAPDGRVAWMHGHALVRSADGGDGAELYGYIADVTAQKALESDLLRAREAAEGADRAKSAFLAMVSHELRTPLVAVTGTLEVLALGELQPEQRERVRVADRSARGLLDVIGDVLDLSRIEAGHLELVPGPVALPQLVRELAEQHAHRARRKGLDLDVEVADGLAPAHVVDALRLRQVLGNLVGNAIRFTTTGGVRVRVGPAGDADAGGAEQAVELVVRDTGVGIAPEDQERLFAPFSQVGAPAGRHGGTGLGLVICMQLVEAMGGTIAMESAAGVGTVVRVRLSPPVATADEAAAAAPADPAVAPLRPAPSRAAALAEGSLVLLVEDHPVNRTVLAAQLDAAGLAVDVAGDADEAAERFAQQPYGLVLTDIQLPGEDGYALAARLRAHEAGHGRSRTPIVALTASALRGEAERCRAAGMDDLVTKPTTIAVLAATARRWMPHLVRRAPAPGPPTEPAVDRTALDELAGGDPALADELLTAYALALVDDVATLRGAVAAGDPALAGHVAHRMGSAARMVGATAVADAAEALEHAVATDGRPPAELVERVVVAAGEVPRRAVPEP